MNRRGFFTDLASGLIVSAAPTIFAPQLIKPIWKPFRYIRAGEYIRVNRQNVIEMGEMFHDRLANKLIRNPLPNLFEINQVAGMTWYKPRFYSNTPVLTELDIVNSIISEYTMVELRD